MLLPRGSLKSQGATCHSSLSLCPSCWHCCWWCVLCQLRCWSDAGTKQSLQFPHNGHVWRKEEIKPTALRHWDLRAICFHSVTKPLWLTQLFTRLKPSSGLVGGRQRDACSTPTISPSPQSHSAWACAVIPVSFGLCYPLGDSQHHFPNVHRRVTPSNHYRGRQVT